MNEGTPTGRDIASGLKPSLDREPRRAVLSYLLSHDYQIIRDHLEHPTTQAEGQLALSDLQNLKARLIQEMESKKDRAHPVEHNYFQALLRSIDLDIQGFTFRQEQEIPTIDAQRANILDAIYSGRFNLAEDWLEALWMQPDARAVHLQLEEELKIVEDISDPDFQPTRSLLSMKVMGNLDSLPMSDLHHLPNYVEKQKELLAFLERIKPLAEGGGWTFEWSGMRNYVLRSVDDIREHATQRVMGQLQPTFDELQAARLVAEENLQELKDAEEVLATIEDEVEIGAQQKLIEDLKIALSEQYHELEILQIALGSEDITTIEFIEEDELDQLHLEIHQEMLPLEKVDRTLRQQIHRAERDLMRKVTAFLTRHDIVTDMKLQRQPIEAQLKYLHRKIQAVQNRRNNQELLRQMHAIHRLDVRTVKPAI